MDDLTMHILKEQSKFNEEIREELTRQRLEAKEVEQRMVALLSEVRDELNVYKTFIKVVKTLGLTLAFALAFKFGDISDLWKE